MTIPKVDKPTAVPNSNSEILVSWNGLAENLGITKYKVLCVKTPGVPVPDGITDIIDNLTVETYDGTVTEAYPILTPGVSYTFTVTAWDAQDNSSVPSDPSDPIIVVGRPDPPTGVTLSVSGNDIILSWIPPVNNGYSEITQYSVYDIIDNSIFDTFEDNGTYSRVLNGGYTRVRMKARNEVSSSVDSALSNILGGPGTGSGPPSAPLNVTAVPGTKSAVVSWEAPTSSGGSEITGYVIRSVPDNKTPGIVGADEFSFTMIKLITGTSYTFRVSAVNSFGYSGQSNAVIPYAIPGTPKIGVPELGNLTVTLNWTAVSPPAVPILSYKVTRSDSDVVLDIAQGGASGTCQITTGLVAGTPVTFFVTSTNANGDCLEPGSVTVSPISLPDPPPYFVAYVGKIQGTALLYWAPNPPNNGGTPLTGYVLTFNEIVINLGTGLSYMVYVKDAQAITFSLVARNKLGLSEPVTASIDGIYVNPASITVSTVPSPPPYFVGYVGKLPGTVIVHWVPRSPTDGGTPLTGYVLTYNGITMNVAAGAVSFTDFVIPNAGITLKIVAKNKIGSSTPLFADILGGGDLTGALFPRNPPA